MKLHRAPLALAFLFAVVEIGGGCTSAQAKPDAPLAAKRPRKKKRPRTDATAPIAGEEEDEGEGGEDPTLTGAAQEGVASFYADSLAGRRTASGARYDPNTATCAHRTLPFGTLLRVEEVDTGRTAVCVVNDRGPYVSGRVVDVSKKVAREIGFQEKGVTRVRIHVMDRPPERRI
jgi:rare lipoprotein A